MSTTQVDPEQGRRARKKEATRRALQRAALMLAAEQGVEQVTVEAVSDAVDVSPRTFFNYFHSKEEALVGDVPALGASLLAALETSGPGSPVRGPLRAATVQAARELAEHREELVLRKKIARAHPDLLSRMLGAFGAEERALARVLAGHLGTREDDLEPVLLAALASTALRVAFLRWNEKRGADIEALVGQIFDRLEQGV